MILSEKVLITLNFKNIKHYESLGYIIPKHIDNQKRLTIKNGTTIEVKVEHLSKGSHVKILCQCDICKKENLIEFKTINKNGIYFCKKCICNNDIFKQQLRERCLNKKLSISTKNKISKSLKGRIHSEESKQKMRENSYLKGKFGKDNPFYKHNLTDKDRLHIHKRLISGYISWKNSILYRDNYICQKCGSNEYLQVHHINNFKDFKEQRLDINNGVTLCKHCHCSKLGKGIHNIFGQKTTKEQYDIFIKN